MLLGYPVFLVPHRPAPLHEKILLLLKWIAFFHLECIAHRSKMEKFRLFSLEGAGNYILMVPADSPLEHTAPSCRIFCFSLVPTVLFVLH